MLKETLSQTNAIDYPLFALVLFVLVFTLVTVRVLMRGKNDPQLKHLAALPLADDGVGGRTVTSHTEKDHDR